MTKKRMLADVLWEAANERLWDGVSEYSVTSGPSLYSCDAIFHCFDEPELRRRAKAHLVPMGCDIISHTLFTEHEFGPARQGVRYMWLLLAMHVAEDEGLTV